MGFIEYLQKHNEGLNEEMNDYLVRKNQLEIYNASSQELVQVRQDMRPVRWSIALNNFILNMGSLFSRSDRYPTDDG